MSDQPFQRAAIRLTPRPGKLARAYSRNLLASSVILLLGLVTGSLAARLLGADGRGLLAIALFAGQLVPSLTVLGLSDTIVARQAGTVQRRPLDRALLKLAAANYVLILTIFTLPIYLFLNLHGPHLAVFGLVFFAVQLLDVVATQLIAGALRAQDRFVTLDAFRVALPLVYALSMVSLLVVAPTLLWFLKLNILAVALIAGTKLVFLLPLVDHAARGDIRINLILAAKVRHAEYADAHDILRPDTGIGLQHGYGHIRWGECGVGWSAVR